MWDKSSEQWEPWEGCEYFDCSMGELWMHWGTNGWKEQLLTVKPQLYLATYSVSACLWFSFISIFSKSFLRFRNPEFLFLFLFFGSLFAVTIFCVLFRFRSFIDIFFLTSGLCKSKQKISWERAILILRWIKKL